MIPEENVYLPACVSDAGDAAEVTVSPMRYRRGRQASLPVPGYTPAAHLVITSATCIVHVYPEEGGEFKSFAFHILPVPVDLQMDFAKGFQRTTGPSGSARAPQTVRQHYDALAQFAHYLATLQDLPRNGTELAVAHLERYRLYQQQGKSWRNNFSAWRTELLAIDTLTPLVRAWLMQMALPPKLTRDEEALQSRSYSRAEERRIVLAARRDLRAAAARIRTNLALLQRWRANTIDKIHERRAWQRGYLLNELITTGEWPQSPTSKYPRYIDMVARHGGAIGLINAVCLTANEAAAACVLLISETGINGDAILAATIAHERADGEGDKQHIALVEMIKPRRGQRSRYLRFPFTDLPSWVRVQPGEVVVSDSDEVSTPFGIYTLLQELTAPARQMRPSLQLFLWATARWGRGQERPRASLVREGLHYGAVPAWGRQVRLTADMPDSKETAIGTTSALDVSMRRLRLTAVQRLQRPVAHTLRTLQDVYLLRDVGGLVESQRIVAQTQAEQVDQACEHMVAQVLAAEDIQAVLRDPQVAAQRFRVHEDVLKRVVSGQLNTVLAACTDFTHSPFTPSGSPCTASFLLCLSCPCARVTPQHLPLLLVARDAFEEVREGMTVAIWMRRFARPYAQLDEVIGQFRDAALEAARAEITDADRKLVHRLLRRELDLL